jgi:hypothetical protein
MLQQSPFSTILIFAAIAATLQKVLINNGLRVAAMWQSGSKR